MEDNYLFSLIRKNFEESCHENGKIDTEEVLSVYSFLTYDKPKLLETALEVIDKQENRKIVEMISESTNRSFYVVDGSQGRKYLILSSYCPCQSFSFTFNKNKTNSSNRDRVNHSFLCKHLLAISVAASLNRVDKRYLSDASFIDSFRSIESGWSYLSANCTIGHLGLYIHEELILCQWS